jgi:hypothetical protein
MRAEYREPCLSRVMGALNVWLRSGPLRQWDFLP